MNRADHLSPTFSLYLDTLRVGAALAVYFHHCIQLWYPNLFSKTFFVGHLAVIFFFVLSGYLISHSVYSKNRIHWSDYLIARFSRIYSVIIPAVVISTLCIYYLQETAPGAFQTYSRGADYLRLLLCSLNLQNIWFFSSAPPINAPFWSLSYEVWYYVFFGIFVFARGNSRALLLSFALLIAGPNIFLLFPCWLVGVLAYRLPNFSPGKSTVFALIVFSALCVTLAYFFPHFPFPVGSAPFYYSGSFVTDFLIACSVASMIYLFFNLNFGLKLPRLFSSPIRLAATHSFSIYLLHYPLLCLSTVLLMPEHSLLRQALSVFCVLCVILIVSHFTEQKRGLITHTLRNFLTRV